MSRRVIKIDTKHNLTKVVEWLERNVGPITNRSDIAEGRLDNINITQGMPQGEHWKLLNKPTRYMSNVRFAVEFDEVVDEGIILYFALRWV
jgi:hypothetical protein